MTKPGGKKKGPALTGEKLARLAAEASLEMNAFEVVILEVGPIVNYSDYFVIASARSVKQAQSIADNVAKRLRSKKAGILGREGEKEGRWVLIDFGEIVVHIFHKPVRDFYEIEKLWGEARRIELPEEE